MFDVMKIIKAGFVRSPIDGMHRGQSGQNFETFILIGLIVQW